MGRLTRILWIGTAISGLVIGQSIVVSPSELALKPWGGPVGLPEIYTQSLDSFLNAEQSYRDGDLTSASRTIRKLWDLHPPGGQDWQSEQDFERGNTKTKGVFFGTPVCYSALRMLDECVNWRLMHTMPTSPHPVRLTILMVGKSTGVEPNSPAELSANTGHLVHHSLDSLLQSGDDIIEQSLFLFEQYISAITSGRLRVENRTQILPDLDVAVRVSENAVKVAGLDHPALSAGLSKEALASIWRSLDSDTIASTDWWMIIYPSHVPASAAFAQTEFITGGMATGPDMRSPAFIVDDAWLTRVPPHLGSGMMTEPVRRAWLPQWLQHEFFHHLYRAYPDLGLEKSSHQWFARSSWPAGFEGSLEADYYAESLHRRLQPSRQLLHLALLYAQPSKELLANITPGMLRGRYIYEPESNNWHEGIIDWNDRSADAQSGVLRWTNAAGKSWRLFPDMRNGLLRTGEENPYSFLYPDQSRAFHLVLRRDIQGNFLPEVSGFMFQGNFFRRLSDRN